MTVLRKRGFTLIELMIVVAIIGLLAAIAIPNFIKFQARSKVSEVRMNLKGMYTAQKAYYQNQDSFNTFDLVGYQPERGNRFQYEMTAAVLQDRTPTFAALAAGTTGFQVDKLKYANTFTTMLPVPSVTSPVALTPDTGHAGVTTMAQTSCLGGLVTGTTGDFIVMGCGDVDSETTGVDAWYISTEGSSVTGTATACTGSQGVSEGTPGQTFDDVACD